MEKIIDKHIDAWDPIGIADCDVREYDIEAREICRRLPTEEFITLGGLTELFKVTNLYEDQIKHGLIVNSDADFNEHVLRVANRMKIAEDEREFKVSISLRYELSHKLFWHGKEICTEHEPKCKICPLSKICPSKI